MKYKKEYLEEDFTKLTKVCPSCKRRLFLIHFWIKDGRRYDPRCAECNRKRGRAYYRKNRKEISDYLWQKKKRRRIKELREMGLKGKQLRKALDIEGWYGSREKFPEPIFGKKKNI